MKPAAVASAIAALAAVGLLREVWFHTVSEPLTGLALAAHEPRPDARYQAARALLPTTGAVGYLSDSPCETRPGEAAQDNGCRLYQQALYSLAPLVLRYDDTRAAVVLANFSDPARLAPLAAARGLAVSRDLGHGVALLRKAAR